jgi:hypothetical protein
LLELTEDSISLQRRGGLEIQAQGRKAMATKEGIQIAVRTV